eukprot:TCALIF_10745-PA protein Name:"Similar to ppk28 Pickpocket protein 28 (Drosophila melanogaster)" AED:0.17 eAED:0.17 QI:0/0/0/0.66/1/1/3/0/792
MSRGHQGSVSNPVINGAPQSPEEEAELMDLFHKFCSSSTIHGTYFWTESKSRLAKIAWGIIVLMGVLFAIFIINSSFKGWKDNPVVTSVMQKSIEEIPFPAITICPMDDTRFGYVERMANQAGHKNFNLKKMIAHLLRLIHTDRPLPQENDCLLKYCIDIMTDEDTESSDEMENCVETCPARTEFIDFFKQINTTLSSDYEEFILNSTENEIEKSIRDVAKFGHNGRSKRSLGGQCLVEMRTNCSRYVKDFRFLRDLKKLLQSDEARVHNQFATARPGTILKMIHSLVDADPEAQKVLFDTYLDPIKYPTIYSCSKGDMPVPDLVTLISSWGWRDGRVKDQCDLANVKFGEELIDIMRTSLHPPHAIDEEGKVVPNAAFPYCWYDNKRQEGAKLDQYPEGRFCNAFQTVFNDHGLCYTYNNFKLGMENISKDSLHNSEVFKMRSVAGCGKDRGLQLVVDNHRLTSLLPPSKESRGFKVFITLPGVVSSKVPFIVDTSFYGEHSFYLHGIHHIRTSEAFQNWNEDNKICHFPEDFNLSYFSHYSQDNCLLECRIKKLSLKCECSPWYIKQSDLPICGTTGNRCFEKSLKEYSEDLKDRKECGCLNDCEGVHLFATMFRESYDMHKETSPDKWYNAKTHAGLLADYLLDPQHIFIDELSKNMLMLAHNVTEFHQFAEERFHEDIAVLNFFFDTPIITQIKLELRTSVFDMISAVGGTLGLFTGISVITFVEILYWICCFVMEAFKRSGTATFSCVKGILSSSPSNKNVVANGGHDNAYMFDESSTRNKTINTIC